MMENIHIWKDDKPYLWLAKMPIGGGVGVYCDGSLLSRLYRPWTISRALNALHIPPSEVHVREGYVYNGEWIFRVPPHIEPTNEELAAKYGITVADHDETSCAVCRWNRIVARIPSRAFPNMQLVNAWKSFQGQLNPVNAGRDGIAHELWRNNP